MSAYAFRLGEAPLPPAPPAQEFYEEPAEYVIDLSLSAGQELKDQYLQIDGDADFIWLATKGTKTGNYLLQFRLPSGRWLSNAPVRDANEVGTAQFPVPIVPAVVLPASARLNYYVKDLSGAANAIQIVLVGKKVFRTS